MLTPIVVTFFSFAYIALLFFVARRGDRKAASKRWQPVVYTLSISTVCTSWTFYGAIEQLRIQLHRLRLFQVRQRFRRLEAETQKRLAFQVPCRLSRKSEC